MIIVITGPTGVGKTKLSEHLAKKYNAIIVNTDAVQVYKELNIGSAKPKEEEKENVPHLLFDIKSIEENYTVADFQKDIRNIFEEYKNENIILVGGTGLYISAALYDYKFSLEDSKKTDYSKYTDEEIYELALQKDKNMDIHKNNRVRLERFLDKEVFDKSGDKLLYDAKIIGLSAPRDILYDKINKRVLDMIDEGLISEVENLMEYQKISRVLNTAIGYKEVIDYLNGVTNKNQMIDLIQKNSRRYAKRQYTWFNNKMDVKWFDVDYSNFSNTIKDIEFYLEEKEV